MGLTSIKALLVSEDLLNTVVGGAVGNGSSMWRTMQHCVIEAAGLLCGASATDLSVPRASNADSIRGKRQIFKKQQQQKKLNFFSVY